MLVLVDIDGVLADSRWRKHLEPAARDGDWQRHWAAIPGDAPVAQVIAVVQALHAQGHEIRIVSARGEFSRVWTCDWLAKHEIVAESVWLRPVGCLDSDHECKRKIVEQWDRLPDLVIEDTPANADMFRKMGCKVLLVQHEVTP